MSNTLYDYI